MQDYHDAENLLLGFSFILCVSLNEALVNVNEHATPSISYAFIVEIDESGI